MNKQVSNYFNRNPLRKEKHLMNKSAALLSICACLLLTACHNRTETTETIPAQLELGWEQEFERLTLSKEQTTISPDLAQQLLKIGDFRSSSSITYAGNKTKTTFTLIFSKEITSDEMHTIIPLLKTIFKDKPFKVTFHGQQKKHIIRDRIGLFSHKESVIREASPSISGTVLPQLVEVK